VQVKEYINYRGQSVEARKAGTNRSCWKHHFDNTDEACHANILKLTVSKKKSTQFFARVNLSSYYQTISE
jgi:hypothetical protein